MKPDDFEKQLQRQPLRAAPTEWRAEIMRGASVPLAKVSTTVPVVEVVGSTGETPVDAVASATLAPQTVTPHALSWWREWLWPSPRAWAGLAALWIAIAVLNSTTAPRSSEMAKQTPKPSPETETTLAAQRRELARLLDNFTEPVPTPKAGPPGPRSENVSPPKV